MKQVCEVDMDESRYLGTGEDGVYFDAAEAKDGWYMSAVADSNTGGFVDSLVTDDGPYTSEADALEAGLNAACEWLVTNEILRGWVTDEKRMRREFKRMRNAVRNKRTGIMQKLRGFRIGDHVEVTNPECITEPVFTDVIRGLFYQTITLEPYGRNEVVPAAILEKHSWAELSKCRKVEVR